MTPTTSATNRAPSRNRVRVIRAVSPVSLMKREVAKAASAGDEAVVAQELADLVDGRVRRRQNQVGLVEGLEVVVGAAGTHGGQEALQRGAEHRLVPGLDRLLDLVVEAVEGVEGVVVEVVLTLAEDAHDHARPLSSLSPSTRTASGWPARMSPPSSAGSIACGGALPALSRASSASTSEPELRASSSREMSSPALSCEASSRAPEAISSSMAAPRACIWAVLSSARWMARPTSPISSPMPDIASPMRVCASAAV